MLALQLVSFFARISYSAIASASGTGEPSNAEKQYYKLDLKFKMFLKVTLSKNFLVYTILRATIWVRGTVTIIISEGLWFRF